MNPRLKTRVIDDISEAAAILRSGGLVAFPTETVYGLGADATSDAAIQRLFIAKGRPSDNPLIVHLSQQASWPLAASRMTQSGQILLDAFSPGPITVVLPKAAAISTLVTASLDSVGIRIPAETTARNLLQRARLPIAAPSANRSGRPSCTTWQSVLEDLDGRIDAVLLGADCGIGLESTVVDCTADVPVLLRPGGVSLDAIRSLLPEARSRQIDAQDEIGRSPGLRHPHYQPRADVVLLGSAAQLDACEDSDYADCAYCGMYAAGQRYSFGLETNFVTLDDYAKGFYEFLREVDRRGLKTVYVVLAPEEGIGLPLRDRQLRAAGAEGL